MYTVLSNSRLKQVDEVVYEGKDTWSREAGSWLVTWFFHASHTDFSVAPVLKMMLADYPRLHCFQLFLDSGLHTTVKLFFPNATPCGPAFGILVAASLTLGTLTPVCNGLSGEPESFLSVTESHWVIQDQRVVCQY